MQDIRQQRLESDREMYARRLQLAREEAEQKAEEASKRCIKFRWVQGAMHSAVPLEDVS